MARIFRKVANELRSALSEDQINAAGSLVGIFTGADDQVMRLIQRAYAIGRKDKTDDIMVVLNME